MRPDVVFKSIIALFVVLTMPLTIMAQTIEDAQKAYNAAVTANGEGNIEEAISQFTSCVDACQYLVDEEEDEAAEELLYTVQAVIPKLYLQLGTTQLQNSEVQKGLDNIYKAKQIAGDYGDDETQKKTMTIIPKVHYKLGASKYKKGELDAAITELDKAIAVNADYATAYYLKAVVYKKKDDDDALVATSKLGMAAAERANDKKTGTKIKDLAVKHFLVKGNEAKGASKLDDAIKYLNTSIEFAPTNATTHYLLAQTYSAQKNYTEAISSANNAIENESGDDEAKAKIYMIIAEAHTSKGNKTEACAAYKKAAFGQYAELANYRIKHELKCE